MSGELLRFAVACSDASGLDSPVSQHMGHCPAITLVEVVEGSITSHRVIENPHAIHHARGAMPELFAELGASVVIAGGMGWRALDRLRERGIEASTGHTGTARSAVEAYLDGEGGGADPCRHDHGHDACGD